MECKKVIELLEKQSPKSYACDWDNVGLLVGREDKEIQKIYIALDATDEAIEEAIANGAVFSSERIPDFRRAFCSADRCFLGRHAGRACGAKETAFHSAGAKNVTGHSSGCKNSRLQNSGRDHRHLYRAASAERCVEPFFSCLSG